MRVAKHRVLVASVVMVVLAVVGALAWRYCWPPTTVPPADNAYVGLTKEQIIGRFGKPDGQWPGHYGNPPLQWAQQYQPCETLTYAKWSGTLYISVYEKNGQWICFCSNWLPRGAAF